MEHMSTLTRSVIRWSLYREILRSARVFPSRNRARIVEEIRVDFRKNIGLEELAARENLQLAMKGLEQLNAYSNLPKRSGDWQVHMDSNPMPRPPSPTGPVDALPIDASPAKLT